MRQVCWWMLLSCKRYLKRPGFVAMLLLLPVFGWFFHATAKEETMEIRVAVCVEGGQRQELGSRLADRLTGGQGNEPGLFQFYQVADAQAVMDEVASRRAECGYVIHEDLEAKLDQNQGKRSITVYSAPSTVTATLSTEVVFSQLMELYDKDLLKQYVLENPLFDPVGSKGSGRRDALTREAGELYDKWSTNGSTFRFTYEPVDWISKEDTSSMETQAMQFPVRGLMAVLVFAAGLFGAVTVLRDKKSGLFSTLTYELRVPCQMACLAAPVVLSMVSGFAAVQMAGIGQGWLTEWGGLLLYGVAVVVFSYMLGRLFPNPTVLCCLIPLFLMSSLIFCPVFIDVGRYVKSLNFVGKWLLPYYYLLFW